MRLQCGRSGMIEIPETFYAGEVRSGFFVNGTMKRAWAAELLILMQLQDFFQTYGIQYWLDYGSLLGAVRHGGFIPWDDDIDITMNRENYMRFLSLRDRLPETLRMKTIYDEDETVYNQFHAVVCNTRARELQYECDRMREYGGCPFIAAVDVFPLDYIPRNDVDRQYQRLLYNIAFVVANRYDQEHDTDGFNRDLHFLEEKIGGSFDYTKPLRPQLYQLADRIAMMCPESDADEMSYYPYMVTLPDAGIRNKEWYMGSVELPFECVTVSVPLMYNRVLMRNFGNYMSGSRSGAGHGYPFYEGQEEVFRFRGNVRKYNFQEETTLQTGI